MGSCLNIQWEGCGMAPQFSFFWGGGGGWDKKFLEGKASPGNSEYFTRTMLRKVHKSYIICFTKVKVKTASFEPGTDVFCKVDS